MQLFVTTGRGVPGRLTSTQTSKVRLWAAAEHRWY